MSDQRGEQATDGRPVKDDAAVPKLKKLDQRLIEVLSILNHVKDARTRDTGQNRPQRQIAHPLRQGFAAFWTLAWQAIALSAIAGKPGGHDQHDEQHRPES